MPQIKTSDGVSLYYEETGSGTSYGRKLVTV